MKPALGTLAITLWFASCETPAQLYRCGSDTECAGAHQCLYGDGRTFCQVAPATQTISGRWQRLEDGTVFDRDSDRFWRSQTQSASWTASDAGCDAMVPPGIFRLPNIDELREVVLGCRDTATGGACSVSTTCTQTDLQCWSDTTCTQCGAHDPSPASGCYWETAIWGSEGCAATWSSTMGTKTETSRHWTVDYGSGAIVALPDTGARGSFCVADGFDEGLVASLP